MDIWNILTLGYKKNNSYYEIIREFKEILPRPQNKAKQVDTSLLPNELKFMSVVNVATHKTSITEKDLDIFYNRINNFDYSFVLFKDYYKAYTENLNRFNPQAENKNFDIVWLQTVLYSDSTPLTFFKVFAYHLKYKWQLTSKLYLKMKQ